MSLLVPGKIYKFKVQPSGRFGGMLATSHGEGAVITTAADRPGVGDQTWMIKEGSRDSEFTIVDRNDPACGLTANGPKAALTLTKEPTVFKANSFKGDDGKDTVAIYVVDPKRVGSTWYVGTKEQTVVIQPIPVIPNHPEVPKWEAIESD
ncbi:hypothetical protein ONZ45_g10986 [Pleurotus djamor]|nr:hypothetical protein ONZ45_g10986 [Pleurotus djamor]